MEALIQAIDSNILKVVYHKGGKKHSPGAQILPEADARQTNVCQVCAEQSGEKIVFQTEEGIFARQNRSSSYGKGSVSLYVFRKCPRDRDKEDD